MEKQLAVSSQQLAVENGKLKKKFKIKWKLAVDWDFGLSLDIQMLIVEWLFLSGWKYQQCGTWGYSGVFEMLENSGCVNCQYYGRALPVFEKDGLRRIISRAVLKTSVAAVCRKWRNDYNIKYEGSRIITATNNIDAGWYGMYDGCKRCEEKLNELKSFVGKKLNYSPNEYHPKSNIINSVTIRIEESGLTCRVEYGDKQSSWDLCRYPRENKYVLDWIDGIIKDLESKTFDKAVSACCEACSAKLRNDLSGCSTCDKHLKEPRVINCIDCDKKFIAEAFQARCPHCSAFQVLCDICEKQMECEGGFNDPECGFEEISLNT